MKNHFAVILNFETQAVDAISLDDLPVDIDVEEYLEETMNYSLTNCQWMVTTNFIPQRINF